MTAANCEACWHLWTLHGPDGCHATHLGWSGKQEEYCPCEQPSLAVTEKNPPINFRARPATGGNMATIPAAVQPADLGEHIRDCAEGCERPGRVGCDTGRALREALFAAMDAAG